MHNLKPLVLFVLSLSLPSAALSADTAPTEPAQPSITQMTVPCILAGSAQLGNTSFQQRRPNCVDPLSNNPKILASMTATTGNDREITVTNNSPEAVVATLSVEQYDSRLNLLTTNSLVYRLAANGSDVRRVRFRPNTVSNAVVLTNISKQ
jgi:hypothetical protein